MSTATRFGKHAKTAYRRAAFERIGDLQLSTPIVSSEDGPRMAGIANFGGKKAAPFVKGGKRRAKKVARAKMALKGKGGDYSFEVVGDQIDLAKLTAAARKALPASAFVFPSKRAYPIHDRGHAIDALARSKGKPEHAAVVAAVRSRYPTLGKGK